MKLSLKLTGLLLSTFFSVMTFAQPAGFPHNMQGHWKGKLQWFRSGQMQEVSMQLIVEPADSLHTWHWKIIYGDSSTDNRPYKLILKDSVQNHWVIDENNGIVLDQFYIGNRLLGSFTVQNNTITSSYHTEGEQLIAEFISTSKKVLHTTGKGTEDVPEVQSYSVKSYQKALLVRIVQ